MQDPYYIIKAANHDARFGPDYKFAHFSDRARAGEVAVKMAERTRTPMTVMCVVEQEGVEIQIPDGTYGESRASEPESVLITVRSTSPV
jgi:hypothetical protein